MASRKTNLKTIVETAITLFGKQGYANTSLQDIAVACRIRKATLYYYFSNREALTVAVVAHLSERLQHQLFSFVADQTVEKTERRERLLAQLAVFFMSSTQQPIPPGRWLLEAAFAMPPVAPRVQACLSDWQQAMVVLLAPPHRPSVAKRLALDILAQLQGTALLGKLWQNEAIPKRLLFKVAALFREEKQFSPDI